MTPNNRYRLLMAGTIVIVLLNAWGVTHALGTLFNAQKWLAHTLHVITATQETTIAMGSANNAARAYLLTGSPEFVNRYQGALGDVKTNVDRLSALTGDNDRQQQHIVFLRKRIAVRIGSIDAAMGTRQVQGSSLALSPAALRTVLADSPDGGPGVRYVLQEIQAEEERLLQQRTEEAYAARRNVVLGFAAATLLDLVLLVLAFQQLINSARAREQLAARSAEITALNARLSTVNAELITLNAELEARVEQRTRELEVSNQELQAFSYSVSHDLRAPLRTIDGFSLALVEDFGNVLNAEGQDYIQRVRNGVQRMGMLIDALLQLSRVTRSEVQRETVNLSQLASLIFNELLANEPNRDVSLTVQPDMVTEADPRLMRVAFENLFGNALKFTSKVPAAHITFGRSDDNGETVYFIQDNGAGFDMQYVDRLFTAFQRLHGDRDFKGSGIGLATVSRIVRRHHGRIWAEGATGQGAKFSFTLNGAHEANPGRKTNL